MADYKDYIVRYDIIADTTKAMEGLQAVANIAKEFEGPMNALKTAIKDVARSAYELKQNSQITFAPKIDVSTFNNQLKSMVVQVRSAAAEMHAAIYEALTANPTGHKAVKGGINNAFKLAGTSPELKKQLDQTEKFLQDRTAQIKGLNKTLNQSLTEDQRTNAQKQLAIAKTDRDTLQKRAASIKAALKTQEELDKQAITQQERTTKALKAAASKNGKVQPPTNPQPPKLTNVTPATIREWKKAFGDSKSKALTVNIRGNATGANGALTVINQIQTSLKTLQDQATFSINPLLNTEGFAAAEARLRNLANLSAAVVAPFNAKGSNDKPTKPTQPLTKDEKAKLVAAQKQVKEWNKKIAPIQSRLETNQAIPEDKRSPAVKGQITKDTKTLATYQANKAEQEQIVNKLQGKSTAAVQKATKTIKPLAIDIIGELSKINVTAKAPVVPVIGEITKLQGTVTEAIPVSVKLMTDTVAASLKSITPPPVLEVQVHLKTDGVQQKLQALANQAKATDKTAPKQTISSVSPTPTPTSAQASATPISTSNSTSKPVLTSHRPTYTPPTFTPGDEQRLNSLASRLSSLSSDRAKAQKAMEAAKEKLDKSGGSDQAFSRYLAAQRKHGAIRQQYLDVNRELQPLMFKQFQSTAQRPLTDDEIKSGLRAQSVVDKLAQKKRLNAEQKAQLSEANQTLSALRAPMVAPPKPLPGPQPTSQAAPVVQSISSVSPIPPVQSEAKPQPESKAKSTKGKKIADKPIISGTVDTKDIISQIRNIPKQTIPIAIKLMWEKGAVGRQEQIKKISNSIPPIKLNLDTTNAITKLEDFVAKIHAANSQTINLTSKGTAPKAVPTPAAPTPQKPTVVTPAPTPSKPIVASQPKNQTETQVPKPVVADTNKKVTQPKNPTVSLILDTTEAMAKLEAFIAKIQASSPQNIKLTATGATAKAVPTPAAPTPQKPTVVTPAPQKPIPTATPAPVITTTAPTIVPPAETIVTPLPSSIDKVKPVVKPPIITEPKPTVISKTPKPNVTVTSPLPKVEKKPAIKTEQPKIKAPKAPEIKLKLDVTKAEANLLAFIEKIKLASPQTIQLITKGSPATQPTVGQQPVIPFSPLTPPAPVTSTPQQPVVPAQQSVSPIVPPPVKPTAPSSTRTQKGNKQSGTTGHQPLTPQERYDKLKQQSEEKAKKQKADNKLRAVKRDEYTSQQQAWRNQQQAMYNRVFEAVPKPDYGWAMRKEQQRATELAKMREDAKIAFAKPTPYEQKMIDARNKFLQERAEAKKIASATSVSSHMNKLERMRSSIRNSILPFVRSQGDLETIFKNYKFFAKVNEAMGTVGADGKLIPFSPTPNMPNGQMLQYLNAVKTQMQTDGAAIPVKLNNYISQLEEQIKKASTPATAPTVTPPPSGFVGSGKNRVSFGEAKPSATLAPTGYHWEKTNTLATHLTNPQAEGMQKALAIKDKAFQNLKSVQAATQSLFDQAKDPKSPYLDKLTSTYHKLRRHAAKQHIEVGRAYNQLDSYSEQLAALQTQAGSLEAEKQALLKKKSLNSDEAQRLTQINDVQNRMAALRTAIDRQHEIISKGERAYNTTDSRADRVLGRISTERDNLRNSMLATPIAQRKEARQQYQQARKAVNAYTNGYQLAADESAKPAKAPKPPKISHRVRTKTGELLSVQQLRAQAQNAMLPFAQNKEQLNMLTKHRRFFRQAVTTTGIMPTSGMEAPQMLKYLQGVSTQMQRANVAVPWQLQSQINKLEAEATNTKGIGETTPARRGLAPVPMQQKSFFDRTRKWAYPFTGQTSFGVRTPMAVDMAKGMGVMFAIGGAMSAIGSSFSQAMEYQNTMRTTQAILQNGTDSYSQNSFRNMEEIVRNVGVKTKFSAPEVANAARFLSMAGYDIDAINNAIRPIADIALIGDTDLGETADKMTNIMTTFNIAPERMREVANIMATTATRSNTDLMMLAESAKYGGGVANMYGRNDPNLFADTMALFGVMGNAGIQASSAGTALRMMYQNIFNPNKKQAAILQQLKNQYGISTTDSKGQKRSMADIIIDMANRIPDNVMPDVVGKLFRITAQPGANATLLSATDIALDAAGGDINTATSLINETNELVNKLSGKNSKKKLSALSSLIQANRNSVNGNISGAIAEEKQNTIQGLWAQVTSTFTEGIVQAFEKRQGGFEGMLKNLRDYLAKPETIQMMQNLMDMIVEIGKVMGWFVKVWASLYNAAPGLIKFWVVTQMAVTQMGTLIAPVVSLIGVFDRLKGTLMSFIGMSALGTGNATRTVAGNAIARSTGNAVAGSAASAAAMNAPFVVGHTSKGKPQVIKGNAAVRAHQAIANNSRKVMAQEMVLAGSMLVPPPNLLRANAETRALHIDTAAMAMRQRQIETLNEQTRAHYAAVRERANRIYGTSRAARAFKSAATAIPTVATLTPMFGGLKSMLMGLLTGLAKAAGFLVNPITLVVGAIAGFGFSLYKLKQRLDGTTEAQQRSRAQANKAADQTNRELTKEGRWYQDMLSENIPDASHVISTINTEQISKYNSDKERFNQLYAAIFNDFSKDANKQSVNDVANKWRKTIEANPAYSLALGKVNNYDFSKKHKQLETNPYNTMANAFISFHNVRHAIEDKAINQRYGMVQDALMIEGANDLRTKQAIKEIADLRRKYLDGETTYKSEEEYQKAASVIRDRYMSQFTAKIPAAGMTPEQFQQTSNRSVYDTYQLGAQNLLNATINGQMGTLVGKMNAYQWLSDAKNRAKLYTKEWYNAISNIIGDYRVIYNAVSADGQQQANIELMLSTLPNGRLNFTNILDQIREKIANFNLTIQGFSDIIGTAYKMMAEAGKIDIKDRADLSKQIRQQLIGAKYGDTTPAEYYKQWIANNENSEWVKAGISEKQYVDFIMGRSGETLNLGNRVVTRKQEQSQMWSNMSYKTADTILQQNKHLTEQAGKLGAAGTSQTSPTPVATPASNQTAYASPYERSAAKPTQIVFNINNLASFDRTTVASSAEERDLIATMEEKITGAVYQMFAEASNQAQRVINLT